MTRLQDCTREQIAAVRENARKKYDRYLNSGISLNMARGKPSPEQLNLSDNLLNLTKSQMGVAASDGTDCRNYGALCGIEECRKLFGDLLGVESKNIIACGSTSLSLMFDFFSQCYSMGVGGCTPWGKQENPAYIAVVPGYDRHFAIAQYFGVKLINVPITKDGPDMDMVEALVRDEHIKGMFCVPKYSNPDGVTYSAETVERLAALKPAAKDFRVIWDEAYIIHDLYEDKQDVLVNIFDRAKIYGNENHFVAFASTSKITFAGAGVAAIAASDENMREILSRMTVQIISYDKMNQLRHCYYYKTVDDLKRQMKRHAEILRPKFKAVQDILEKELSGLEIAEWSHPLGGYFISLNVKTGSAKYVWKLCRDAGLILTNVGATYPYGLDPEDANLRIAPSLPSVDELKIATDIVCQAVKIAACEELLKR